MISLEEARSRVAKGAALLDMTLPGWWLKIDTGTLSLSSCTECVMGQLSGSRRDFCKGLKRFGLYEHNGNALAVAHGFARCDADGSDNEDGSIFGLLQDAWIEAIAARQFPDSHRTSDQPASAGAVARVDDFVAVGPRAGETS